MMTKSIKIDGKALADQILEELTQTVATLKTRDVIPTLAVVLVGDNPGSLSYIRQKEKATEVIGAALILKQFPISVRPAQISLTIQQFNHDSMIHGLIVQRPLPPEVGDCTKILSSIDPAKDIDGFVPNSHFRVPVGQAVFKILQEIYKSTNDKPACPAGNSANRNSKFISWLQTQKIVVIGRGETAGQPITNLLQKQHCTTTQINSKTPTPVKITTQADIIISCVGKERVVVKDAIRPGVILISVGLWRDQVGKLHGDYEEEEIKNVAAFYTPTPGGVGPVNVACLMENLVEAAREAK